MIKVRLQIGDSEIYETSSQYGLIYLSADSVFAAPDKGFETTSYAEEEGEHSSNSTVAEAFDYKVRFLVKADGSLGNANAVIARFNSLLYTQEGDVKTYSNVSFYNDYKGVKIVGRPSLISQAESFWRDANGKQYDIVEVEWVIRVSEPSLCDFNIPLAQYPDSGGSGDVDLSDYYTKLEVNNLVESEQDRAVAEEQRLLTLIDAKYSKPTNGIPRTDLSQDVTKWMVQPDWKEKDSTSPSFIQNKPTIGGGGYQPMPITYYDYTSYVTMQPNTSILVELWNSVSVQLEEPADTSVTNEYVIVAQIYGNYSLTFNKTITWANDNPPIFESGAGLIEINIKYVDFSQSSGEAYLGTWAKFSK